MIRSLVGSTDSFKYVSIAITSALRRSFVSENKINSYIFIKKI